MPANPEPEAIERTVGEQFLDILCSDVELLRAEFDSIIAAQWPDPPSPGTCRQPASRGAEPEHRGAWSTDPLARWLQDRPLGREAWRRQRSPPTATSSRRDRKAGDRHIVMNPSEVATFPLARCTHERQT